MSTGVETTLLRGSPDARKVVQDTFLRAHRALTRRYSTNRCESLALRPWLFCIARHLSHNKRRLRPSSGPRPSEWSGAPHLPDRATRGAGAARPCDGGGSCRGPRARLPSLHRRDVLLGDRCHHWRERSRTARQGVSGRCDSCGTWSQARRMPMRCERALVRLDEPCTEELDPREADPVLRERLSPDRRDGRRGTLAPGRVPLILRADDRAGAHRPLRSGERRRARSVGRVLRARVDDDRSRRRHELRRVGPGVGPALLSSPASVPTRRALEALLGACPGPHCLAHHGSRFSPLGP